MDPARPWWRGAVGYEVYIRSFADSDGDGLGDLAGLRARLPHLADLGVDVVWTTPFYPTPDADHGYDVADYVDVDPRFGTVADVRGLVADCHARGLRLLVDLVPNHTSDRHAWFRSALQGRDAPHRDFYTWADPGPGGGPPNGWVSRFGGPAWTYHPPSGQWYLHLFLPEQPDLNWRNPAVRDAFDDVLRFWCDVGVDGFRIDVAHGLLKDPELRDNPLRGVPPSADAGPSDVWNAYDHVHDEDQPELLEVYRRWHALVAPYGALLLGEVYLLDPERLRRYVAGGDGLHLAFCFPALKARWDAADIRARLGAVLDATAGALAWPLSSHDDPYAATRFGGGARGAERALAYFALLCALPGVPFLYQGDELGLDDAVLDRAEDPVAVRNPGAAGRDGRRAPYPWSPGPHLGFTTGEPWLPLGRNRDDRSTAAAQRGVPTSVLERVRSLLALRRTLPDLRDGEVGATWVDGPADLVVVARGAVLVALNCGDRRLRVPLPAGAWRLVHRTDVPAGGPPTAGALDADAPWEVPPDAAAIFVREGGAT